MAHEPWDDWPIEEDVHADPRATREGLGDEVMRSSAEFLEAAAALSIDALRRPNAIGKWSAHDAIAHCAVWADYCVEVLRRSIDGTFRPEDFEYEDMDQYNERTAAERAAEITGELLDAIRRAAANTAELLGQLPEDEWRSRDRYQLVVRGTLSEHLPDHRAQLVEISEERG